MTVMSARARHNSLRRYRAADDPEVINARRALRDARIEDHVRKLVADAPDLTAEQRSKMAVLLLTSGPPVAAIAHPPAPPGTRSDASPRRDHKRREVNIGEPCPDEAGASPPGARPAARTRRNHVNGSTDTSVAAAPGAAA